MKKVVNKIMIGGIGLIACAALFDRVPLTTQPVWSGFTQGTTYSIKIANHAMSRYAQRRLRQAVDKTLAEISRQMSLYDPASEISQFNRNTSTSAVEVSFFLADACRMALDISGKSGGAFDPTLNPLLDLWGFGIRPKPVSVPGPEEIRSAMEQIGYENIAVISNRWIQKNKPTLQLNLNAIAQGYSVDAMARLLAGEGLTNFMVEIGGEVVTRGRNAHGQNWRIGINQPERDSLPGADLAGILCLSDQAVSTSGDYRNFHVDESGHYYSHILDPRAGIPVTNGMASVTVVAGNCALADALATALFVLGPEQGALCLTNFPGASALFIRREADGQFTRTLTPGFDAALCP